MDTAIQTTGSCNVTLCLERRVMLYTSDHWAANTHRLPCQLHSHQVRYSIQLLFWFPNFYIIGPRLNFRWILKSLCKALHFSSPVSLPCDCIYISRILFFLRCIYFKLSLLVSIETQIIKPSQKWYQYQWRLLIPVHACYCCVQCFSCTQRNIPIQSLNG